METGFVTMNENWLERCDVTDLTVANTYTVGNVKFSNCVSDVQWWYGYPVYHTNPARPIKLTLAEVEALRKAAKTDEKLKAVLKKFTAQIEVTVEF